MTINELGEVRCYNKENNKVKWISKHIVDSGDAAIQDYLPQDLPEKIDAVVDFNQPNISATAQPIPHGTVNAQQPAKSKGGRPRKKTVKA